jgi:hypothetical protein
MRLRTLINQNCKECGADSCAPGTWLQQVTLCSVKNCKFHPARPKTTRPIPISVLSHYQINSAEYERINQEINISAHRTEK